MVMAGGIPYPLMECGEEGGVSHNPLLCYLCQRVYQDPCLLSCFHSFCDKCLRTATKDSSVTCPICRTCTRLPEGGATPEPDLLLRFLVESAQADSKILCANCDQERSPMHFCNTCCQPLCGECRSETHQAKMFASHDIVPLSHRPRDIHTRKCSIHLEPLIMFSAEKSTMMCINCFRDLDVEKRTVCVDLDSAYADSSRKLEDTMKRIQDLVTDVEEGISQLRTLVAEVKQNAEQERVAILTLFSEIQEKITDKRNDLLEEAERQYKRKDRELTEQLRRLSSLRPVLGSHLLISSTFCCSANKYQFLEYAHILMERMRSLGQGNLPVQPTQNSQIFTDYMAQFARSLESLFHLKPLRPYRDTSPNLQGDYASNRGDIPVSSTITSPSTSGTFTFTTDGGHKINGSGVNNKVIMLEANGTFANHFKTFENKHREVVQKFEMTKKLVQEIQRDLTLRRCLSKHLKTQDILDYCVGINAEIISHLEGAEKQRPLLEKHWEAVLQKIANEQQVYQAQVNDILRMKQESQHLSVIAKQLVPFINSITSLTQRIVPVLGETTKSSETEEQIHALLDQINIIEPDSRQRVEAIRSTEEDRQFQLANRVNPLDGELTKTKGLLRAPSERPLKGQRSDEVKLDPRSQLLEEIKKSPKARDGTEDKFQKDSKIETERSFKGQAGSDLDGDPRISQSENETDIERSRLLSMLPRSEDELRMNSGPEAQKKVENRGKVGLEVGKGEGLVRRQSWESDRGKDGRHLRDLLHNAILSRGEKRDRHEDNIKGTPLSDKE